ncbi:hypothetical protein F5Y03DRAFT_125451 [Xylaria venustula]|nr:hypothetical protein F5Y03DRAFT_125451 [Xylaria venustula]
MLPPINDAVLKNNPRFEKLYNTITTSILNADGSTKADPAAKQRDAVCQELQAHRLKAARVHLLRDAISSAVPSQTTTTTTTTTKQSQPINQETSTTQQKYPTTKYQQRRPKSRLQPPSQPQTQPPQQTTTTTNQLPPDLLQLLLLIPAFLNNASTLPSESVSLLLTSPPFTQLPTLFPSLITLTSTRLTAQAKTLARVLSPSTNPSYIHRVIPSLPSIANTLRQDHATSKTELSRARLAATTSLTRYLSLHTDALRLILRALEAKHDTAATSSELRAMKASQEAHTWAIASEALLWETRCQIYPPEARAALAHYRQHLRDAGRRLEDGSRVREAELADYGVQVVEDDSNNNNRRDSLIGGVQGRPRGRGRRATLADENKERTMREMARVWREMEGRLREIQGDLHRLR